MFLISFIYVQTAYGIQHSYNSKCDTLLHLQEIEKELFNPDLQVKIPPLFPLNSNEIKNHLDTYAPNWKKLADDIFFQIKLEKKKLTKAILFKITKLQELIQNAFVLHNFSSSVLLTWLQQQDLLIVRSSGNEDSDTFSNAGGNSSIPYVQPNIKAVSKAIGEVIASYFSPQSLSQQLLSNEPLEINLNLFIQKMICNLEDSSKIVSGVLYTTDPENTLPKLTLIQAVFGNAEGLVQDAIENIDTYYVYDTGTIHATICANKEIKKPTLSEETVKKLKEMGSALELHFQKQMDVEWVYDYSSKIIYLVQARPIIFSSKNKSSYVLDCAYNQFSHIKGHAIVNASNRAIILKKEDILFANNIVEALSMYLKNNKIKAVFLNNNAPSTAHAAAIFRSENIPVLSFENLDLAHSNYFLLDIQKATIFLLPNSFSPKTTESLEQSNELICQGNIAPTLCSHKSIAWSGRKMTPLALEAKNIEEDIKISWKMINTTDQREEGWKKLRNIILTQFQSFRSDFEALYQEYQNNIDENRYRHILHWLQCLLFQNPSQKYYNSYSIHSIGEEFQKTSLEYLHSLCVKAFTAEIRTHWNEYIITSKDQGWLEELCHFVKQAYQFDFFLLWLNKEFQHPSRQKDRRAEISYIMKKLKILENRSSLLRELKEISLENPLIFDQFFQKYFEKLNDLVSDREIFHILQTEQSPYIKLAISNYLFNLTERLDEMLKMVKGSPHYTLEKRLDSFCCLLQPFFKLMNSCIGILPDDLFTKWSKTVFDEKEYLQKDARLKFLQEAFAFLSNKPTKKQLFPSKGFSVQAASIGSGCAFFRALTGERKW